MGRDCRIPGPQSPAQPASPPAPATWVFPMLPATSPQLPSLWDYMLLFTVAPCPLLGPTSASPPPRVLPPLGPVLRRFHSSLPSPPHPQPGCGSAPSAVALCLSPAWLACLQALSLTEHLHSDPPKPSWRGPRRNPLTLPLPILPPGVPSCHNTFAVSCGLRQDWLCHLPGSVKNEHAEALAQEFQDGDSWALSQPQGLSEC